MKVLVINSGSSSVKFHLYLMPKGEVLVKGLVERIGEESSNVIGFFRGGTHTEQTKVESVEQAIDLILDMLGLEEYGVLGDVSEIKAVGHRVVHGGEEFTGSVVVDDKVVASIERFADLAPLHNPPNLAGIRAVEGKVPGALQVACFDTAFHSTIPQVAYMYALPYELYEKYGIRRYGFHGISHRYVARRAAEILGRGKYEINAITCHLGNGCSIAAVKGGRSVDTSMGFTPLEGVPMGTRCGDIDPAILFYLEGKGYDVRSLNSLCNKESGLLGLSGVSNDVRNLAKLSRQDNSRAKLACDVFCYRIKKYIGAYTAALDTVDAVVFTGGIGENAVFLRRQICSGLTQIGLSIDEDANLAMVGEEGQISTEESRVKVLVVPTNEQAAIANDTYELARGREPVASA